LIPVFDGIVGNLASLVTIGTGVVKVNAVGVKGDGNHQRFENGTGFKKMTDAGVESGRGGGKGG